MRIAGVLPDGMAAAAGMQAGDVLEAVAGEPVTSLGQLRRAVRLAAHHDATTLRFCRDGSAHEVDVAVVPHPREANAEYGCVEAGGVRLRTITTRPARPRGAICLLQGIACESVDLAARPDEPLAGLIRGWTDAGYATLRVDKHGLGDSEGIPCRDGDFDTELAGHRAALDALCRYDLPRFVFGHSVGGMAAALLAPAFALSGVIVYGTSAARWLDCLVATTRRQMALRGHPAADIDAAVADLRQRAFTEGLNGRSAAYHGQLDAIDLDAAWHRVTEPKICVLHGEHDWVVSRAEQQRIVAIAGPERAKIIDVPGLDHVLGWHDSVERSLADYGAGRFAPDIVQITLEWMNALTLPSTA